MPEFSDEVRGADHVDAVAGSTRLRFEADHDSGEAESDQSLVPFVGVLLAAGASLLSQPPG